jgi:hypothetical protein
MRSKIAYIFAAAVLIFFVFHVDAFAGPEQERPKFKISVGYGSSAYNPGTLRVSLPDDPIPVDGLYDINYDPADRYVREPTDYSGRVQIGYNFSGPWYVNGGLYYERNRAVANIYSLGHPTETVGRSLLKTKSIITFVAIEYTNKFWKLNYNSGIGFGSLRSRSDIVYALPRHDEIDAGTYAYNSTGVIISGGLGYELYRFTSIKAQLGYRFFGSSRLEPPSDIEPVAVDFSYDGVFFGIGMEFGFSGR